MYDKGCLTICQHRHTQTHYINCLCPYTVGTLQYHGLHMYSMNEHIFNKLEWISYSCMCALLLYTHTHNLSPSLTTTEPSLLHFFCICHPGACQCLTPSHAVTHTHICTHAAIFLYKKNCTKSLKHFFLPFFLC